MKRDSLDNVLKDIDSMLSNTGNLEEREPITIWVSKDYKKKYDEIQKKTKRKFTDVLRNLFIKSIDKVHPKI